MPAFNAAKGGPYLERSHQSVAFEADYWMQVLQDAQKIANLLTPAARELAAVPVTVLEMEVLHWALPLPLRQTLEPAYTDLTGQVNGAARGAITALDEIGELVLALVGLAEGRFRALRVEAGLPPSEPTEGEA